MTYFISISDYLHLLVIHGSAVPVTDDIYTSEECESHAVQVIAVRNVELDVRGGGSCQIKKFICTSCIPVIGKTRNGLSWMNSHSTVAIRRKAMNKYRDKSDVEINKAVAEKPGKPTDKARLLYYIFNW